MPLSDFRFGTGELVHAGKKGRVYSNVGQIYVTRPAKAGFDANLFGALKVIVDSLKIAINVNSVDTGRHSTNSRHYDHRAVDTNKVRKIGNKSWQQQAQSNRLSIAIVNLALENGWHIGEGGNFPGVLLGPPWSTFNPTAFDHATHLHLSIARRPGAPGAPPGDTSHDGPELSPCDPDDSEEPAE